MGSACSCEKRKEKIKPTKVQNLVNDDLNHVLRKSSINKEKTQSSNALPIVITNSLKPNTRLMEIKTSDSGLDPKVLNETETPKGNNIKFIDVQKYIDMVEALKKGDRIR
jgi:hypothetical protein